MKSVNCILFFILLITLSCKKDEMERDDLSSLNELSLYLKSGQEVYSDENNNEYLTVNFDHNLLNHVFGIYMEKGKKYNISISGPCFNKPHPLRLSLPS